jgi:hypothetical protein
MQFKKLTKGYIYILTNSAYAEDLLKIGMTIRTPEERAMELYKTGVPAPFIVSYKRSVANCNSAENAIHKRLQNFRINSDREFFKISLDNAKMILDEVYNLYSLDTFSEEEYEREYWRHIVKTDQGKLHEEEYLHKSMLENTQFVFIGKGKSVLFPDKAFVSLDDLKKSDKFIKRLLEERERERKNAYLERQKLSTQKKGLKGLIKLLYKILTYP